MKQGGVCVLLVVFFFAVGIFSTSALAQGLVEYKVELTGIVMPNIFPKIEWVNIEAKRFSITETKTESFSIDEDKLAEIVFRLSIKGVTTPSDVREGVEVKVVTGENCHSEIIKTAVSDENIKIVNEVSLEITGIVMPNIIGGCNEVKVDIESWE